MLPPGFINIALHYVITKLEAIMVMSAGYIFLGFGGGAGGLRHILKGTFL
jgi:hypothetical protein